MNEAMICLSCHRALLPLAGLILTAGVASAQVPSLPSGAPLRFEGQIGTHLEAYSATGRAAQRPSRTARLALDATVMLFGSVRMGVNLLASTEGSSAFGSASAPRRQQLNQIGLTPEWSWGRAYLGSFSDSYTPLTWNGTQVRGAGFAIQPGLLRLAAFGGRSQRAVAAGATYGAYGRTMLGGRIGVGSDSKTPRGGSHLDFVFMRASDDISSLPPPVGPIEEPPDIFTDTFPGPPINQYAVTPQENVVIATQGALSLLDGMLVLRGELGGAIHTRDKRASSLDAESLERFPSVLRSLIAPRVSTSGDYAYTTEVQFRLARLPGASARNPGTLDVTAEYRYIGPGYVSLGAASLLGDQRAVELQSRLRFRSWSLALSGMNQQDNLIGQKLATTDRSRFTSMFLVRPTRRWTATFRGAFLSMGSDTEDPARRIDYTNWIAETSQTVALSRNGLFRRAGIRYSFRASGDANPSREESELVAHAVSVQASLYPTEKLSVTPSIGLVESRSAGRAGTTRQTYSLGIRYSMLAGRWTTSASVSNAALESASSTRASIMSRFGLTSRDDILLGLRTNHLTNELGEIPDSKEYSMTLELRHRL